MIDLSIIIVSWNVRDLLRRCLHSVFEVRGSPENGAPRALGSETPSSTTKPQSQIEIIVVDNGSTDGSPDLVRSEFPEVVLVANDDNVGYAAANNQGLALSRGRYLLLLNPDTRVVGDALATMVRYMETHPETGALGPQLRYPDGTLQPSRRRFPTFATALVESTVVQEWWHDNSILRRYYMSDTPDDEVHPADWLVGACLLVRRQVYEQVGGLDEGFFMYSEELDWCRRIRAASRGTPDQGRWQVVYLPTATVIHHEGKSSEQVVPARHIHFQTSKVRYFGKHHGPVQAEALRWFLLSTYVYQWAREGIKWLLGHKRPLRAERMAAYRQVLRSRLQGYKQ